MVTIFEISITSAWALFIVVIIASAKLRKRVKPFFVTFFFAALTSFLFIWTFPFSKESFGFIITFLSGVVTYFAYLFDKRDRSYNDWLEKKEKERAIRKSHYRW